MKRFVSILMAAVLLTTSITFVYGDETAYADREYVISEFIQTVGRNNFSDNSADLSKFTDKADIDYEYIKDMEIAVANNIVTGYNDNTLKPDNYITRAEAAVILSRCLGEVEATVEEKNFSDVPQWALADVNKLTQAGIINGYDDTTFGSNDKITAKQVGILTDKVEAKVNNLNIKDDYYNYVNNKFERNNKLENGNSVVSSFGEVEEIVDNRVKTIIDNSINSASDDYDKRIKDIYNLYMDVNTREQKGIEELQPYIDMIDGMTSINGIPEVEAKIYTDLGFSPLLGYSVYISPEDSSKYIITLGESYVLLDRDSYFEDRDGSIKNSYLNYVSYILNMTGEENSSNLAKKVYDFEKSIIQKSGTTNYDAYEVVYDRNILNSVGQNIDAEKFIDIIAGSKGKKVAIFNTEQYKQMSALITNDNIDTIKAYYKANIINAYGNLLSKELYNQYYKFYNSIFGSSEIPKYEESVIDVVKTYAGVATINKYAQKYYNSEKEQYIKNMINDIKSYYKTKIQNNTWLSKETKEKAITKLNKINVKVGYDKTVKPYASDINIVSKENGGTITSNIIGINKVISEYEKSLPDTSVNKNSWPISSLITNACYVPNANEIVIPMGIMEDPFYSEYNSYSENLGGIGFVIAHEISHAFDPSGADYDENGNKVDWWTEADRNKFYDLADDVIEYFNKYEVVNGIDNDGEETVLENVADLSGYSCVVGVAKEKGGDIKAVTRSFCETLCKISTDKYKEYLVSNDSHSYSSVRVNGVLSSTDEFYDEYNITENDGMYKAPEERVKIW